MTLESLLTVIDANYWIRLFAAVYCGAVVGLERQLRGKPVGIRTSILIAIGTMFFTRLGVEIGQGPGTDPTRVLGQIASGIGFLGAGVILTRDGLLHGVTSAAGVWLIASIGCAIGLDRWQEGIVTTLVSVAVLNISSRIERYFPQLQRGVHSLTPKPRGGRHKADEES